VVVQVGAEPLTADDLLAVAGGEAVRVGPAAWTRMAISRAVVERALESEEPVYGLTRRLGAGAGTPVEDQDAFQRQVVRNHLGGLGEPLPAELVRAAMAARLAHLAAGGAGVRPEVADALAALLNSGVVPAVPDRGSVGAADLVQNAAVAAVLIGEGRVLTEDGTAPGGDALRAARLEPLALAAHEGLSLLNTNAFSLAAAALLADGIDAVVGDAGLALALSLEAAALHRPSSDLGPFSALVHEAAPEGQVAVAAAVRDLLDGSFLADPERERRVQDELSFRCAPQVHGAVADAVEALLLGVDAELASRPENPLVDAATGSITPNGNFAAVRLALDLERSRLALAHLGQVIERRIAVLSGLAAPLRRADRAGIPGLLAYTAAEDLAELRQLAAPVTLGAAPLSEVEDYATFAWTAARAAERAADIVAELVAIEALHAASLLRAVDDRPRLGAGTAPVAERLIAVLDAGGDAEALVVSATAALAS
jgi:histidine ammonia-lyase